MEQFGDTPGNETTNTPVARKHEQTRESVHKASPKNGIPPKRTIAATDRKFVATPSTASKPTASSMARKTPNGSLSKASPRPLSTADGRHSQAATTASITPSLGRKSGSSVSSTDGSKKQRFDPLNRENEDVEDPPSSLSERAGSTSPVKFILKPSSERSTLATSTTTDRRPNSTSSPSSKATSTRGSDDGRVRPGNNVVRHVRMGPSPSEAKTTWSGSISKRSSTISASPSIKAKKSHPTATITDRPLSPQKRLRPGLGTRKSTMSVTIEQRLHEMSLVHQMLHAAMAAEGDEDDEVKEAYGKQMDEQLAALKARLERARREEGLVDSGAKGNVETVSNGSPSHTLPADEIVATRPDDHQISAHTTQTNVGEETSRLEERERVLLEQLKGADVSELDEITPRELKIAKLELLKVRFDYENLRASNHDEVNGLQKTVQTLTERLNSTQASGQTKERDVSSLERVNQGLQEKVQELESNSERHTCQHKELIEAKDTEIRARQEEALVFEGKIQELHEARLREDKHFRQVNESFQDRMLQFHESSEVDLSRHHAAAEALERRIEECEQYLEGHKRNASELRYELGHVQASKDRELNHQQQAIESLQDKILQLNETKERELQDVRQSLLKEHDEAVSNLQSRLDHALAKKEDEIRQQDDSNESGESAIEELRNIYKSQHEQLRATLASVHASNTELRHDLDNNDQSHKSTVEKLRRTCQIQLDELRATLGSVHASNTELRHELDNNKGNYEEELSELKIKLEQSAAEASGLRAEIETVRQQFSELGKERDTAQSTIELNAAVLRQLSENVANLRQELTSSNNEELALLEKNSQAEKGLAATKKLLDDVRGENQRLSADHEIELVSARKLRAELERSFFKAQEGYNDLELGYVTLQSQVDALRADLDEASSKAGDAANQQLVKLCGEIETANEARKELDNQLQKAKAEVDKHKTKARELESALKVTTAELVELRTDRPSGSSYSGSPIPKPGLRSSRWWTKEDEHENFHGDGALMAGMQEHIRQMNDMNEELMDEEQRLINMIQRATKSPKSTPAIAYRHVRLSPNARGQHTQRSTSDEAEDPGTDRPFEDEVSSMRGSS